MVEVSIPALRPGMIVGRTVRQADGVLLLARGVLLNEEIIEHLRVRGIEQVWVSSNDELGSTPVDGEVSRTIVRQVDRLFSISTIAGKHAGNKVKKADRILQQLKEDVEALMAEILTGSLSTRLGALGRHSPTVFDQSLGTAIVAAIVSRKLFLDLHEAKSVILAGLLHDIGLTRVPKEILEKPLPRTFDENEIYERHTIWGAEILTDWQIDDPIPATVALQHHERQDGKGYPRGRIGTNRVWREPGARFDPTRIHFAAEVVSTAEMYTGLFSGTTEPTSINMDAAIFALRQSAGHRLNRQIVESLFTLVPSFPIGTPIRVIGGPKGGHTGFVVEIHDETPSRPVVRLLSNSWGERIRPFVYDTLQDDEAHLRAVLSVSLDQQIQRDEEVSNAG